MGVKDAVCFIRENPFGQKFIPWIFLFFSAFSQPSQLVGLYGDESRHDADTRVHGSWLVLARAAWILAVALSLAVSIADIPLEFRQLHMVCVGSSCGQQLTAGILQDLHHC